MKRASEFFSREERAGIERVVAEAEAKTSAEIVPAIATSSGRYDRSEDLVGFWLALIFMSLVWLLWPERNGESGAWGFHWSDWGLPAFIAAGLAGLLLGAVLADRIPWLRRLFTPRVQMRDEVDRAARSVFFDSRVHHTEADTGILVYISLFERMAAVIADQGAVQSLGPEALEDLCTRLSRGLQEGRGADALCEIVQDIGDRLAGVLPRSEFDRDELSNALVILD